MTINNSTRTAGPFTGNGVTAIFPFSYKVFARSDLLVARTVTATAIETILTLDSDYTVTLNTDQNANPGGTITMIVPPPVGTTLAATSNIPITQSLDLTNGGGFYPRAINDALDRMVIQIQQVSARAGNGLAIGVTAIIATLTALATNLSSASGASLVGGAGQVIPSISTLRTLLKTAPSKHAFVTGYYAAGDGGGGSYFYDVTDTVSADDGVMVIVAADGGRWKLAQSFAPSLAQCGVKKGMTNGDQTAAINAVLAARVGKETYATAGDYRTDGSVYLTNGARLTFEKNARFYRSSTYSAATTPVLYVIDSYTECDGGLIQTDNGSPAGVMVIGHKDNADNRNAWYGRVRNMDLQGNGVAGSIGWAVTSGQISYPLNANYFSTIQNINTKNFDIGCFFNEDANAHNVSNCHFWQCKTANIWLRGAYANNFVNMFFHGSAANGCIGIKLSNKAGGPDTDSNNNCFTNWTCETGGSLDQAIFIDTNCNGNILIGTTNVSGGNTINNYNNTIIVTNAGIGGLTILPGGGARTDGVISRVVTPITPAGLLGTGDTGASLVIVEMAMTTNNSLNRTDLLLINSRNSGFSGSTVTVVSSAWTNTGTNGEPAAVAYALSFASGAMLPRLTVNVTPTGPDVLYNVRCRLTQV